ncbi:MAG: TrbG/VirB9 family P-type conjugative transfer protein [Legionella sp.]|nr:TrbG/VirB9 family P-type conjugative transfer protein [Legionella sp.]
MFKHILLGLFCLLLSNTGLAKQTPQGLVTDNRIKVVAYDPNNVVEVKTAYGYATTLILEKGEFVTFDGGMGKKAGWEVVSKPRSNLIILKPLLENNATNLNFQTNKNRFYTLALKATRDPRQVSFMIRFEYPSPFGHSPFAMRADAYALLENFGDLTVINDAYSFKGDTGIAPIKAQDNGTFTLLKFRKGCPIPAILAVDLATRRESMVNFRVHGDYVIVEGVYPQMTLRYGAHVTCLFNDKGIAEWYARQRGVRGVLPKVVLSPATRRVMP